jgi:trigger factor
MEHNINIIDDNRIELSITISKEDYLSDVENELKKKKKEANLKGFRKGMVPDSFMRRTFGNSILADIINKKIDSSLSAALEENKIEPMLSPVFSKNQKPLDIDIFKMGDYSVIFDIHKKPNVELKGISEEDSYTFYEIETDESMIDNQIKKLRSAGGKFIPYEGAINDDIILSIHISELENGEIKPNGYESEFSIKTEVINDHYKNTIKTLRPGDTIDFDIYDLVNGYDENKVKDHLLNIDEKDFNEGEDIGIGKNFRGKIVKTESFEYAELTPDIFEKYGLSNINNEEEYREYLRNDLRKYNDKESSNLLHMEIAQKLKEINNFSFSEEYIKNWLSENYSDKTEKEIDEITEKSIKDLQWQTIIDILIKKYKVEVTQEEMDAKVFQYASSIVGNNYEMVQNIVQYIAKDEKQMRQFHNELYIDKIFGEIANNITKVTEKISVEEFNKLVEKHNRDQQIEAGISSEEE